MYSEKVNLLCHLAGQRNNGEVTILWRAIDFEKNPAQPWFVIDMNFKYDVENRGPLYNN